MTVLRLITDIDMSETPSDEDIHAVSEQLKQFAHGVVAGTILPDTSLSYYGHGHVHISNEDFRCTTCTNAAKDGRE